jgi:hypothetical protein
MLLLLNLDRNHISDVKLAARVPTQEWEALRRTAVRFMKARFCPHGSMVHLEQTPYETSLLFCAIRF